MGRVEEMVLIGGHPAVDFVNTLGGLPGVADDEYLHGGRDFLVWSHRVGLIARPPSRRAADDDDVHRAALVFRAALDRILRARLRRRPADQAARETVREFYREAVDQSSLHWDGARYRLVWRRSGARRPLARLAAAAVELITGDELDRLAQCGRCRWLFIDLSRSHTRRWCTMNSCGAITKMRRYRRSAD